MSALPARTASEPASAATHAAPSLALTPSTEQQPRQRLTIQDLLSGRPLEITLKLIVSLDLAEPASEGALQPDAPTGPMSVVDQHEDADVLLTAEQYGQRRQPRRSAEWVRDRCRDGKLPGARKEGREWYIPASTLADPRIADDGAGASSAGAHVSKASLPPRRSSDPKGAAPAEYPRW